MKDAEDGKVFRVLCVLFSFFSACGAAHRCAMRRAPEGRPYGAVRDFCRGL